MALLIGYTISPTSAQDIDVEPMVGEDEDYWDYTSSMSYPAGPPIADNDSGVTYVGEPITIPVLSNDTGDYDPTTLTQTTNPTNGSIEENPDGTFTYKPNPGFSGVDAFNYEICNADSSVCSTAAVTVTVLPPPDATDDLYSTPSSTPITFDVLTNDGGDIDPGTIRVVSVPTNGVVEKNPDNTFTYTPNPGFDGPDKFVYEICNADKSLCSTATVTIVVVDLPVANDDVETTYINIPVDITVLTNDGGTYEPSKTKKLTNPSNGGAEKKT